MPAPRKSLRPKARTKKAMRAAQERAETGAVARGNAAAKRLAREEAMTEAMMGMKDGGKLKMVKGPGGKMVPDYAADGVGKMAYGGKAKVKKMADGGSCRGMGAATRGGNYKMG